MTDQDQTSRKATLSSRISEQLRTQVISGTLPPGEKINLDRLREQFGISISPIREAVARLVADGLVRFEDQRGYTVTTLSTADLDEVTALRGILETEALGAAIRAGDLEWESKVMGAFHRLDRTSRDDAESWEMAHSAFHRALIAGCDRPKLLHFCTVLRRQHDRYRQILLDGPTRAASSRRVAEEHAAIADAAVSREAERAGALLRAHIETTGAELRTLLAASGG